MREASKAREALALPGPLRMPHFHPLFPILPTFPLAGGRSKKMSQLTRFFRLAQPAKIKIMLIALWRLFKHPQTPRSAKWMAIAVLAYAISPIDLIPDFIPVIGLLDDLVLVPLGVAMVIKLTPKPLWEECLRAAESSKEKLPRMWWGAVAIVLIWALAFGLFAWWMVGVLAAP
jgi:uncharacterized membrane protein YkvA (DUF1232 family)